jgi:hypothetical protein
LEEICFDMDEHRIWDQKTHSLSESICMNDDQVHEFGRTAFPHISTVIFNNSNAFPSLCSECSHQENILSANFDLVNLKSEEKVHLKNSIEPLKIPGFRFSKTLWLLLSHFGFNSSNINNYLLITLFS